MMLRLILAVVLTACFVAFAMANGHHVQVSFVLGSPIQVRQIFLLATAVGTGIVGTLLYQQFTRVKQLHRRERRKLVRTTRKLRQSEDLIDD